jgi:hypothetical protein
MHRLVTLSVLFGFALALTAQSTPSFELNRSTYTNLSSQAIVAGDFNGDGKLDLVTGGGVTPTMVTLRLGNGDGTFQAPRSVGQADSAQITDIAMGDLNHDGKLDVVAVSAAGTFNVFFGKGDGTFETPLSYTTLAAPLSVTTGDFYGNGLLDIAIGDEEGKVEIFKNVGGKSFSIASSIPVGDESAITRLRAGDMNESGVSDLAALNGDAAFALWGKGNGTFTPVQLSGYANPAGLEIGDLNQDGKADVLVTFGCNPDAPCGGIDVFYGQGNSTTLERHAVRSETMGAPSRPLAVDVNGDGIADLVAQSGSDGLTGIHVWLGNPDGTFNQTAQFFPVSSYADGGLVAGDFNRDGMMDFAQTLPGDGQIEFYLNATHRAACATGTASPTVTVCQPVNGAYVNGPLMVQANATDAAHVTDMQEYIDSKLVYSQHVNSFETTFTEALGAHALTTKAWDAKGASFLSNRNIVIYSGTPGSTCAAALGTAEICLPASGSGGSSASPVHIVANGYTSAVPTAAQLYIDGKMVMNSDGCNAFGDCLGGTSSVDTEQTLSSGTHRLVFKLWDANGDTYVASKTVTVD